LDDSPRLPADIVETNHEKRGHRENVSNHPEGNVTKVDGA